MGYEGKVISGDCHIDIPWLPEDLFTSNAPAHLKDKVPAVVDTDEGKQWFVEGKPLDWVAGGGIGLRNGAWDPYVPGLSKRLDRMEDEHFFSDGEKGQLHPTTPELRIRDQDVDGISGEVIYGILALAGGFGGFGGVEEEQPMVQMGDEPTAPGYGISDPEVISAVYGIYNNWVAEFCKSNPNRLKGLACIYGDDPERAANQLWEAADIGLMGAELNVSATEEPVYHRDWDALWAASHETGLSIAFHTTGIGFRTPKASDAEEYKWVLNGLGITLFQLSGAEYISSAIYSGACDRYPNFKFVLGECGIGWIPYLLYRMDDEYDRQLFHLGLSMKPSEFWARQGYSTFQIERVTNEMVDMVGVDNIMWGSDYPHPDGIWPDSRQIISDTMGNLEEEKVKKIVCDNTAKLYGFPH